MTTCPPCGRTSSGLVNVLAEPGQALDAAIALAEKITANGPLAVAATKRIIVESRGWTPEEMWSKQTQDPGAGVHVATTPRKARSRSPRSARRSGRAADTGPMTPAVGAADCERAAIRAYLLGADDECAKHWEAAHRAAYAAGDPGEAARYAFWLGFGLLMRGQAAPANGWLSRAEASGRGARAGLSGLGLRPHSSVPGRNRWR